MTVLLGLTESRLSRLGHRLRDGEEFTVTIPEQLVRPHRRWRLCFLIAEVGELELEQSDMPLVDTPGAPSIIGVARLRGSGRPTTTDDRVTIAEPELVDPPLELRQLADPQLAMLPRVTPDTAIEVEGQRNDDLIQSVLSLRSDLTATINGLSRYHEAEPIAGDEGEVLALERDAVHLALSFAGFDVDDTATWNPSAEGGYLSRLAYVPREEVLSRYDASRFPGWQPMTGNRIDWTLFTDGNRSLRVGDVNATKLERILGVDLIYRHLDSDTFVLVQYKKMTRDAHRKWSYRPDTQLDAELERMRKVDTTAVDAAANPATWRLYPRGCFLKLVRPPEFFDPTSDRLLSGIYLPPALPRRAVCSPRRKQAATPRLRHCRPVHDGGALCRARAGRMDRHARRHNTSNPNTRERSYRCAALRHHCRGDRSTARSGTAPRPPDAHLTRGRPPSLDQDGEPHKHRWGFGAISIVAIVTSTSGK
jgi:hypothetical protein